MRCYPLRTFYDNYMDFPQMDCGYCGNTSCLAMLRKYCVGKSHIKDCVYFRSGARIIPKISYSPPALRTLHTEKITYIRPCPSEPSKVTIEVNVLPEDHSPYGYFDIITADKIFDRRIPNLKISPSLGIARIESEGEM